MFMTILRLGFLSAWVAFYALTFSAQAQDSAADLAKKLSNPIASLISVPFQGNYDGGYGPDDGSKYTINVQPVIPFTLNEDWNLISRTIVPIVWQNDIAGPSGDQSGLGDTTQSLFFSPKKPTSSGIIWGVGPVFLLPTATDDLLGGGKWGAGPTAVALKQSGPWTYGALVNHIWSFAGDEDRQGRELDVPSTLHFLHDTESVDIRAEHREHLQLGNRRLVRSHQLHGRQTGEGQQATNSAHGRCPLLGTKARTTALTALAHAWPLHSCFQSDANFLSNSTININNGGYHDIDPKQGLIADNSCCGRQLKQRPHRLRSD